ncbi:Glycine betaine methyltransferase [Methanimicrococcus stummii]|uniref:[trimethylamine--corrinoid protein] Co-methyltransferase n=1 Tax=Methanimicrococcus stummii TaxID=3028294 RepID=A0AA96VBZ4_9EURY|nr:Glycine betaine methyltransferase [Methanimicrococcus sp. Es2]
MAKCNAFAATKALNGVEFELFTQDELKAIHEATMDVFMEPGIQVSDANARAVFKANGCEVDEKTQVVKIPEFVVRRALQTAPSRFTLWARNKKYNTVMECGGKVHWTCFGTGVKMTNYVAPGKYETVDSVEQDIADIAKLCDWAENIDYFSLPVSARDWAGKGAQDVHEVFTPLTSTEKHYHDIDPVGENVETYWEIIKAYYGGNEDEAVKKPIMSMLVCPTSPLELSSNACQVIMKGAQRGMPVNVLSMAMSGGSAPVYLAGTLVTHNAEVLAGIVLAQITNPGAPVYYGSSTTTFDLKMGTAPVGSPELGLISAGVSKLAKFYGLPAFVAGA